MKTRFLRTTLLIVPALLLAACGGGGGGGGGGGTTSGVATPLVITSANSKAVAADAVNAAISTDSVNTGTTLVTGAQVSTGAGSAGVLHLVDLARELGSRVGGSGSLATGVAVEDTVACSAGGTLRIAANVADPTGKTLQQGDSATITATNCQESSGSGKVETINGTMSLRITSGSFNETPSYPFQVAMALSFSNFTVTDGSESETANGDITTAIAATSATVETVTVTGTALSTTHTRNGVTRSVTLRNYKETTQRANGSVTDTVTATVETSNSRLGSGVSSYQISTVTPIVVNSSDAATAGVLKVTGSNSSLLVSVTGSDAFKIEVDDNGDGKFESSSSSTKVELESLL